MNEHARIEDTANLFARDGHPTMLTMDRFESGELDLPAHEAVVEHLDACRLCTDRFEGMRKAAVKIEPPAWVGAPRPGVSPLRWAAAGTAIAAAAALILVIWPTPQRASLRPAPEPALSASPYTTTAAPEYGPTASVDLRLFAGARSRQRVMNDDVVPLDNVLRVEARADTRGWLALVVDSVERGDPDPDEGADDTGGIANETHARMLQPPTELRASDGPLTAVYDVSVDGLTTEERVIAILCPEPFTLDPTDLAGGLDPTELPGLPEGCTSKEIRYIPWGRVASS